MPRQLLREPHLFAHELRTPLTVLAGWYSLIRAGDISPQTTPQDWAHAMEACERAVTRLNLIINEACDEAQQLSRLPAGQVHEDFSRMLEASQEAVTRSREVLEQIRQTRQRRAEPRISAK